MALSPEQEEANRQKEEDELRMEFTASTPDPTNTSNTLSQSVAGGPPGPPGVVGAGVDGVTGVQNPFSGFTPEFLAQMQAQQAAFAAGAPSTSAMARQPPMLPPHAHAVPQGQGQGQFCSSTFLLLK